MDIRNIDFNCDCGSSQYTMEEIELEKDKESKAFLECGDCNKIYHLLLNLILIEA
ncbi:hypothetical protein LCGC14_0454060 [marine sediment metagenome]|uniref:DPH-type MB domain-containing protein n=1 Tax=marine sediment metagenome TaxID=412755 RepID=A0A0F9V3T2_9ZZZZ